MKELTTRNSLLKSAKYYLNLNNKKGDVKSLKRYRQTLELEPHNINAYKGILEVLVNSNKFSVNSVGKNLTSILSGLAFESSETLKFCGSLLDSPEDIHLKNSHYTSAISNVKTNDLNLIINLARNHIEIGTEFITEYYESDEELEFGHYLDGEYNIFKGIGYFLSYLNKEKNINSHQIPKVYLYLADEFLNFQNLKMSNIYLNMSEDYAENLPEILLEIGINNHILGKYKDASECYEAYEIVCEPKGFYKSKTDALIHSATNNIPLNDNIIISPKLYLRKVDNNNDHRLKIIPSKKKFKTIPKKSKAKLRIIK